MPLYGVRYYIEPMDESELEFLQQKKDKEFASFFKVMRLMAIIGVLIPLAGGVAMAIASHYSENFKRELERHKDVGNPAMNYFIAMAFILVLIFVVGYITYLRTMKGMVRDLKYRNKIIEQAEVTRKLYMPQNNTYHLYINSPTRISIEVSREDYNSFNEGDEINIEYSQYSKNYFGYF